MVKIPQEEEGFGEDLDAYQAAPSPVPACIRQIAFELDVSLARALPSLLAD